MFAIKHIAKPYFRLSVASQATVIEMTHGWSRVKFSNSGTSVGTTATLF
jgi:hypothetical protein